MRGLGRAIRSELSKQFTTNLWWVLGIVLFGYVAFTAAMLSVAFGAATKLPMSGARTGAGLPTGQLPQLVYSTATSVGYAIPLLIGALVVTAEFRHKTLTPTFLATPRRGVALGGKAVATALLGAIYAVAALVASVGAGAIVLTAFGMDTQLGEADTWAMLARSVLAFALWALIGVGAGALLRNQIAAVVVVLAFTQFIEPIARLAGGFVAWLKPVTAYLPGAGSDALVGSSVFSTLGGSDGETLAWWGGGLVLLGYAIVLLAPGHLLSWRRDVT